MIENANFSQKKSKKGNKKKKKWYIYAVKMDIR